MKFVLKGKSQKGKNRVREFGDTWIVLQESDTVLFSDKKGPWFFVAYERDMFRSQRWIHKTEDIDFEILEVQK